MLWLARGPSIRSAFHPSRTCSPSTLRILPSDHACRPRADSPNVSDESSMDIGAGGRDRTGKGFRPTDFRTTSAFAAGPGSDRSWSGLSLRHSP